MSTHSKSPLARYPARAIIFDFTKAWADSVIENILASFTNFLAITAHLTGPSRIPLLSVFSAGKTNECLYQLHPVKGSFTKLYRVIQEVKEQDKELLLTHFDAALPSAVIECFDQFERHVRAAEQVSRTSSFQIEIIVFTTSKHSESEGILQPCLQKLDLSLLKKINVVHVETVRNDVQSPNNSTAGSNNGSPASSIGNMDSSFIENTTLHNDVRVLEQFFKSWLIESGTDEVQLIIELPSFEGQSGLTLKCDLQERVINPIGIPSGHNLLLQTDLNYLPPGGMIGCKASVLHEQTKYHMKAKMLIKSDCICESILYGQPFVILPTMCWKLDWEELESNQLFFQAFCSYLFDKNLVLLVEGTSRKALKLSSYFLVLPCSGNSLLVKSVAVRDLMMPFNGETVITSHTKEVADTIERSMNELSIKEEFNPLELSAGFTEQLLPPRESMKRKQERNQTEDARSYKAPSKYVPLFKPKGCRSKSSGASATTSLYGKLPNSEFRPAGESISKPKLSFHSPPDFPDNIDLMKVSETSVAVRTPWCPK